MKNFLLATKEFVQDNAKRLKFHPNNRSLIAFLPFLVIATIFWFLQTLQEETTLVRNYELVIKNVPDKIIFTSHVPKEVSVTLRGRGFSLLDYITEYTDQTLAIDYANMQRDNDRVIFDATECAKQIRKTLGNSITLVSVTPKEKIIYYSKGEKKRVPIHCGSKFTAASQHTISSIKFSPDSIDVYAPSSILSTITSVYTDEALIIKDIQDTIRCRVKLDNVEGSRTSLDSITCVITPDIILEKKVTVPIYCENIPKNKVLRTFPSKAEITIHGASSRVKTLRPEELLVIVDYNEIISGSSRCALNVQTSPEGIYVTRLRPSNVDYVVEDIQ